MCLYMFIVFIRIWIEWVSILIQGFDLQGPGWGGSSAEVQPEPPRRGRSGPSTSHCEQTAAQVLSAFALVSRLPRGFPAQGWHSSTGRYCTGVLARSQRLGAVKKQRKSARRFARFAFCPKNGLSNASPPQPSPGASSPHHSSQ